MGFRDEESGPQEANLSNVGGKMMVVPRTATSSNIGLKRNLIGGGGYQKDPTQQTRYTFAGGMSS